MTCCWLCGFEATELATNAKAATCENGPCQICIAVVKIDDEINQTVAALRRLIAKRCDFRSEQNRRHGALIHRLPVELNNYIFELALPLRDEWGQVLPSEMERATLPSYLASVCRGWRDTALSAPSLWSALHIELGTRNSSSLASRIEAVNDSILRSRTLPLRISVGNNNGVPGEELKAVIDAISKYSNRWHSLSLYAPWSSSVGHLSDLQCDLLKSLRVVAQPPRESFSCSLLNPNVSLEKIDISGVPLRSLQISWNNLNYARVRLFDLEEIAQLFQHASQMTSCHIEHPKRSTQTYTMPPIIHRRLTTFGLQNASSATLLGSLSFPSLQEFQTDSIHNLTTNNLPALVHRSSCPLTRLTLFDNLGSYPFPNLQPLPGVTHLDLESFDDEPVELKNFLLDGYLPDLCHLTLGLETFLSMWDTGITPLLDNNAGGPIKVLVVGQTPELNRMWTSEVGKQLKALNVRLRDDGFELSSC